MRSGPMVLTLTSSSSSWQTHPLPLFTETCCPSNCWKHESPWRKAEPVDWSERGDDNSRLKLAELRKLNSEESGSPELFHCRIGTPAWACSTRYEVRKAPSTKHATDRSLNVGNCNEHPNVCASSSFFQLPYLTAVPTHLSNTQTPPCGQHKPRWNYAQVNNMKGAP